MRESWAMEAPEGLMGGIPHLLRPKAPPPRRDRIGDGLARKILARLPLAVAVINADTVLSFWNERASLLFAAAPLMAAERPTLAEMLARVATLTPLQRDRIVAFAASHVAAGDRTEPDGCLRLSLGRGWRLAIEVHGLGAGRWMVVFDDGKVTAAGNPAAGGATDAWLDSLTGLSNRRHYNDMLQEALDHATADTRQAVMLIDLDGFAGVNETFGHMVGDELLCVVAQRLRREVRDGDLLARLGGDEFALLLPNGDGAEPLAKRILANIRQPFLVEGQLVAISASIGMVQFPDHGTSADDLMRHAHLALYQAKSAGGRIYRLFDDALALEARARRALETDLRKALTLNEVALAYQPCREIQSHRLSGFEVRPRWTHPSRGLIPDDVFLSLAEDTGAIVELNEWALNMACSAAKTWPAPLSVAIRLTARQLADPERLVASLEVALARSGLAAHRLELRIAEAALLGREEEMVPVLHRLRALGVGLTLADFALGASLLRRLRSFPFDGVAFNADDPAGADADADKAAILHTFTAAGFARISCYFGDLLNAAPDIGDIARVGAIAGTRAQGAEQP